MQKTEGRMQRKKVEKKNIEFKKRNKTYSVLKLIVAIICVLIIIVMAFYLINSFMRISSIKTYDINFTIADRVGFDLDQESLNFGTATPGGLSHRTIEITSDRPLKVHIVVQGEVKNWVNFSENDFILDGKKEIGFSIKAPAGTPFGNYAGKVTMFFIKP